MSLSLLLSAGMACAAATSQARASAQDGKARDGKAGDATAQDLKAPLDRSGRKRVGKASFYATRFAGKKMADGQRMDPHDANAASKTLPLGTTAKVTNLETGKSAVVTIEDRGPYAGGRIVDLSPTTAQQIGMSKDAGVAKVEVAPIAVPMPDGQVKPGAAAADAKSTGEKDAGEKGAGEKGAGEKAKGEKATLSKAAPVR